MDIKTLSGAFRLICESQTANIYFSKFVYLLTLKDSKCFSYIAIVTYIHHPEYGLLSPFMSVPQRKVT